MANFVLTYEPSGGTVEIHADIPPALVAPAQIWLRAVNHSGLAAFEESGKTYDGVHHEYYHEWTINGQPLTNWTKPQNLIAQHNNPNQMHGREVGFCLPEAGSYVIDLVVKDRFGNTATASTGPLSVVTPESHFPEVNRIYVDPDGDFSGVPAGAARVTSLEALRTTLPAHNTRATWVLLRKGKIFSLDGVNAESNQNHRGKLRFEENNRVCLVSSFGSGAKPVIIQDLDPTRDPRNAMFDTKQPNSEGWRTFSGLRFEGTYNPETWHGIGHMGPALAMGEWKADNGFCLFHDIETEGTGYGFVVGTSDSSIFAGVRLMVADCKVDGWRDYGFFGGAPNMRLSFIGNDFHQKPKTPNYGAQNGVSTNHGPVRVPYGTYVQVSMSDFSSRAGWDGNDQACLRLFPSSTTGQSGYVDRCTLKGGFEIIHLRRSSQGEARPFNVVIERCMTIGTAMTSTHIHCQRSGLTVRTNVMVDSDAPRIVAFGAATILLSSDTANKLVSGNEADPIVIYGNTYVNTMTDANDGTGKPFDFVVNEADYYETVVLENNVLHKPSGNKTFTDFAPIDTETAIPGVDASYAGIQKNFEHLSVTPTQDIAPGQTLNIPYASVGQALLGGGSLGGATDQSYWQAIEGTDTDHQIYILDSVRYRLYAALNHFSVSFSDSLHIVVTNLSPLTWSNGVTLNLWFDRTSLMPAMDTSYASASAVPLPRPYGDSDAIAGATAGRIAPRDFLLTDRGGSPSQGALEPT